MTTKIINFRADEQLKSDFEKVADKLGLSATSMYTAFMKRTVLVQGVPFDLRFSEVDPVYGNLETQQAIREGFEIGQRIQAGEITESEFGDLLPSEYFAKRRAAHD